MDTYTHVHFLSRSEKIFNVRFRLIISPQAHSGTAFLHITQVRIISQFPSFHSFLRSFAQLSRPHASRVKEMLVTTSSCCGVSYRDDSSLFATIGDLQARDRNSFIRNSANEDSPTGGRRKRTNLSRRALSKISPVPPRIRCVRHKWHAQTHARIQAHP